MLVLSLQIRIHYLDIPSQHQRIQGLQVVKGLLHDRGFETFDLF